MCCYFKNLVWTYKWSFFSLKITDSVESGFDRFMLISENTVKDKSKPLLEHVIDTWEKTIYNKPDQFLIFKQGCVL